MSKTTKAVGTLADPAAPPAPNPIPGPPGDQGGTPPPTLSSVSSLKLAENEVGPDKLPAGLSPSSGLV